MPTKPRPRLHNKISKPKPISFTDLQRTMHEQSKAVRVTPAVTRGAFGGKAARNRRLKAPADLLPASSPVA